MDSDPKGVIFAGRCLTRKNMFVYFYFRISIFPNAIGFKKINLTTKLI